MRGTRVGDTRTKSEETKCRAVYLRCTFVLEPMIASFHGTKVTPELAETIQALVRDNTWFSNVSLWFMNCQPEENEYTSRTTTGQLVSSIFGNTRRSHKLANSRYCREVDEHTLSLHFGSSTKKLEMPLEMDLEEPTTTFIQIGSMSVVDIEALSSILTSEHPKKFFWLNKRGQPSRGAQHLTFETLIKSARIFSDDGSSEWINALVPDYGRCYVQRTGLELQDTTADSASGVMDLKIEFVKDMESILDSLPSFLAAIGYLLKTSTIDISEIEFDVNEIVRQLPQSEGIVDLWREYGGHCCTGKLPSSFSSGTTCASGHAAGQ
ncbi:hypothetical protein F442_07585 [Phytophthora nicotianae P10297]|uniref:Uncharacterized protein n=1 Tax=Phytophthora nicotianae P10297 TaxID=1317064 RepID=W2ZGL3_PHYNI|nr:hypothetical protein F442_07585 [Phytophthora nicotianae P10297]